MLKKFKWRTDLDKSVIVDNFTSRQWAETTDGFSHNIKNYLYLLFSKKDDWNIYWASVGTSRTIFNPKFGIRLQDF